MDDANHILKQYWGYDSFRVPQDKIVSETLAGRDVLALLPTGGGKSICFQVPALALPGITIVISPLIALMRDQVQNLKKIGVKADSLTSGMGKREMEIVLDNAVFGGTKLLYISPERLETEAFLVRLKQMNPSLLAVDEAHCISQWGYDFRPPYLRIAAFREIFPKVPVIALTATATPRVVTDIMEKLRFAAPNVVSKSFERKNLAYRVKIDGNKPGSLLFLLNEHPGSAVVYTRNRRKTQEIAEMLIRQGISASFYHAGLTSDERDERQASWISDKTRVMVATNAFGMGIDKPDVRLVVHMDIPDTIEAYFQEAGRAGRDEKPAVAVAIFNESDRLQLHENFEKSFPEIPFIQRVYDAIGNYLQVAYGFGKDETYSFDVGDFCKKFKFSPIPVLSSLKILELNGYVYLSDAVFSPARVQFTAPAERLYQFEVKNPKYEPLIKLLLRSYGGIFDQMTHIQSSVLSKKLGLETRELYQQLWYLQKVEMLVYELPTDKPQLTYTLARVPGNRLMIQPETYKQRKELSEKNISHILAYMTGQHCRSSYLRKYFGEETNETCGQCDHCLSSGKPQEKGAKTIDVLRHLRQHPEITLRDFMSVTRCDIKIAKIMLRRMMDEELVRFNERGNICLTIKGAKLTE